MVMILLQEEVLKPKIHVQKTKFSPKKNKQKISKVHYHTKQMQETILLYSIGIMLCINYPS